MNDDPVAGDDIATVDEDSIDNEIDVLVNDNDVDGDTVTVTAVSDPAHGTAAVSPDGLSVLYTPDSDYFGPDSFTYTISDGNGGTAIATVNVTVENVNDDPVADDDEATVDEDSIDNEIDVLGNDDDIDGDTLTVTAVSDPAHGAAAVSSDGLSVLYTPDPDYSGPDSFTYTISDGNGGTAIATVDVIVENVNDDPVAEDDTATVDEDSIDNEIDVLDNDDDGVDLGEALTVTAVSDPARHRGGRPGWSERALYA